MRVKAKLENIGSKRKQNIGEFEVNESHFLIQILKYTINTIHKVRDRKYRKWWGNWSCNKNQLQIIHKEETVNTPIPALLDHFLYFLD